MLKNLVAKLVDCVISILCYTDNDQHVLFVQPLLDLFIRCH